ncbi:DUF799 domain-containing protein [Alcaligenes faecalis]|jgi:hypothetical protein|uniref:DUF799 domain-containing protein n=1 Tax=Alcaligenes faecalis TaxID=511 RepID=A0ABY7N4Z9_ALCFA|nr:DUF799 domain-containing protein [Alcaligenes faecalis]KAA1285305.1 hypothetical protein D7S43_12765 [Alcaligenes faecalis]OSZ33239.1 hypothetical protein BVZ28_12615 [Alcaligenes faecalis]OSZ42474.1 hypothetical protein BVZ29_11500 [Alcaligenes faecalis]WBM38961.1 DUF799 domain-containing protein [Alcaligenes faecalis]
MINNLMRIGMLSLAMTLVGCAAPQAEVDYSAFRESKPASILVLPPLNDSVDVAATSAVLSQATMPLAESGYYVMPVAVMEETFRQNGLVTPEDIHDVPATKLREIFGADTALYMTVKEYGAQYIVLASTVTVSVEAELVDLRTGTKLWSGQKLVSYAGGSGGGILGMLIQAVVDQVINTLSDRGYQVAGMTNQALLSAGQPGGILYGPRSPHYETQ